MTTRSYEQICGVARALDLIGERWTLLVVRELLLGPKRFGALADALDGIGPNLLSARLRKLQEAGVVERVELPPPASVSAYALTERGEGLRDAVESLALWGFELLDPEQEAAAGLPSRGSWLAATLAASANRARGGEAVGDEVPASINFDIADERFVVVNDGGRLSVRHGADADAAGELRCGMREFFGLTRGEGECDDPGVAAMLAELGGAR